MLILLNKKTMKYGFAFVIIIFLFSCGQQQSSQDTYPDKGSVPFHRIIYLDQYYTDFLAAIRSDYANRDKVYSEKIKEALMKDHFNGSEYADLVLANFAYPIRDTSGLTKFISDLNAYRSQVETVISSAFLECNKHLKNDSVTFYIVPSNSDLKEIINLMGGVTGQTAGSKQVLLTIDFNASSWKEALEYTVAHEFNHTYWTNTNFNDAYKWNMLRYLIFEGKADSFAHLLYPKAKAPWTSALADKERTDLWDKIKPDLQNEDPALLTEVMFGSKNYPLWGGYTLGYGIMQTAFVNHPELLKTNWTNSEAEKLLEMSSYK